MPDPGFTLELGASIRMPDGVLLNADIYRPIGEGARPALLTLTPYTSAYAFKTASAYARAGFAVVVVDVRGRGGSEGVFDIYQDGADGAACVDWAAAQAWCDGQVALFGGSYAGLNQWAIAARRPCALKAIAPVAAPMPGYDADSFKGLFPLYNLRWTSFVRGKTIQPGLFADDQFWQDLFQRHYRSGAGIEALSGLLGGSDRVLEKIIAEFDNADFWAERVPGADGFARIDVPVLTLTGTADNAQRGALEYRRRHLAARPEAKHYLLIGPWNHAGQRDPGLQPEDKVTPSGLALDVAEHQTLTGFYKWAMCGHPLPRLLDEAKRETVYLAGAEYWCQSDRIVPQDLVEFFLDMEGRLTGTAPSAEVNLSWPSVRSGARQADCLADTSAANWFSLLGGECADSQTILEASDGLFLSFVSDPLAEASDLVGSADLTFRLAANLPVCDLACFLYELRTDGRCLVLSSDMQRASKLGPDPMPLRFDSFRFAARRLNAGSRLGLQIRLLDTPDFQRSTEALKGPPPALTLVLSPEDPCKILLPLVSESKSGHAQTTF